jgi:hypothetical protein
MKSRRLAEEAIERDAERQSDEGVHPGERVRCAIIPA